MKRCPRIALASLPAATSPYNSLVVFGDSLSDSGNAAAAGFIDATQVITGNTYVSNKAYAPMTFSNGPVWASDVASQLGVPLTPSLLGGTNFALGAIDDEIVAVEQQSNEREAHHPDDGSHLFRFTSRICHRDSAHGFSHCSFPSNHFVGSGVAARFPAPHQCWSSMNSPK